MHETIGFAGCGNCHSKSENLMSGRNDADSNRKATFQCVFARTHPAFPVTMRREG
jgi:hypothetical protein